MNKFSSLKQWLAIGSLAVALGLIANYVVREPVEAAVPPPGCVSSHNLSGYAWSENIGWISMNCKDQPSNFDYGVSIDPSNDLVGYAWSDNIGWIQFGGLSTPTIAGASAGNAKYNPATGEVSGWVKALAGGSVNSGDWDGWISLRGTGTNVYGITFTAGTGGGYAWGSSASSTDPDSSVVGWIDFSGVNFTAAAPNVQLTCPGPFKQGTTLPKPGILKIASQNVTSCTVDGGSPIAISTSPQSVSVTVTNLPQTFTVVCSGQGGQATAYCSASVLPVILTCLPPKTYLNPQTNQCECPQGQTYDAATNVCKGPAPKPKFEEF